MLRVASGIVEWLWAAEREADINEDRPASSGREIALRVRETGSGFSETPFMTQQHS
jgi:hypothetical protein